MRTRVSVLHNHAWLRDSNGNLEGLSSPLTNSDVRFRLTVEISSFLFGIVLYCRSFKLVAGKQMHWVERIAWKTREKGYSSKALKSSRRLLSLFVFLLAHN